MATTEAAPTSLESVPSFTEKIETLRNSDVELRLTNRGGGITEAVMLNQIAEDAKRVILNSPKHTPIGAMIDDPAKPALPEFTLSRQSDSSISCERTTPDGIAIRKKFSLLQSSEKKDNFLVELNVDVQNTGAEPYTNGDYFVALGSAAPIHPTGLSVLHAIGLVHQRESQRQERECISGQRRSSFGIGAHPAQPFFQENFAGAEWTAVTDQFFATIIAPLNAKATGIWGRSFEVSAAAKHGRHRRRDAHAGFSVAAGSNLQRAIPDLGRTENLSSAGAARAQRSGDHELRRVQDCQPISAQFSQHHSQRGEKLWHCHSGVDARRSPCALAASKQSESNNAQDGVCSRRRCRSCARSTKTIRHA